jgi:hypothetical protein
MCLLQTPEEKIKLNEIPLGGSLVVVALAKEQWEECGPHHRLELPHPDLDLPAADNCGGFFLKGFGICPKRRKRKRTAT